MRIYGPNGTALAATPAPARRSAAGGFKVSEQETPRQSAGAGAVSLDCACAVAPANAAPTNSATQFRITHPLVSPPA